MRKYGGKELDSCDPVIPLHAIFFARITSLKT